MSNKYIALIDKHDTKIIVLLDGIRFISNPPVNEKVSSRCVKIEYTDGAEGIILTKSKKNSEEMVSQLMNAIASKE